MISKRLLFCVVSIFTAHLATSQITGKIIDAGSNSPLEYATAALYKQKDSVLVAGVITSPKGIFSLSNIKPGNYYLEASFIGYNPKRISNIIVNKKNELKDLGTIGLTLGNMLNEVVVQGERSTVIHKIDRQVFDSQKFQVVKVEVP